METSFFAASRLLDYLAGYNSVDSRSFARLIIYRRCVVVVVVVAFYISTVYYVRTLD